MYVLLHLDLVELALIFEQTELESLSKFEALLQLMLSHVACFQLLYICRCWVSCLISIMQALLQLMVCHASRFRILSIRT